MVGPPRVAYSYVENMPSIQRRLSKTFTRFFDSKKSTGILLITCTIISLCLSNYPFSETYIGFWHAHVGGLSIEHWVNDGLMAIFFLLIGLELERELYSGELSDFKNALLPILAAIGGIAAPALIHFTLNVGDSGPKRTGHSNGNGYSLRAGRSCAAR